MSLSKPSVIGELGKGVLLANMIPSRAFLLSLRVVIGRIGHLSALAALLATATGLLVAAGEKTPNILFILADDLGHSDIGAYGSEYPTPHIDSLARAGAKLTDYYTSSLCTPSRYSLMTGTYPNRSQDQLLAPLDYLDPRDGVRGIRPNETTVAELLRPASYRTAIVGKWHLGHGSTGFLPNHHGFESYFGYSAGAIDYYTSRYGKAPDLHNNDDLVEEPGYAVDLLANHAVEFLRKHGRERPFFLFLAQVAPHFGKPWDAVAKKAYSTLQPKPELERQFEYIPDVTRRQFACLVESLDECVGRVLAALDEAGLADNTIVIFASDNGGSLHMGATNRPFRGQKGTLFEGGIRVPCLVRWPGHIAPGSVIAQPICAYDWLPTFCSRAGASLDGHRTDGRDILPWLEGRGESEMRPLFWDEVTAQRGGGGESSAMRLGDWKYLRERTGEEMLFNLHDDAQESRNLAAAQPARLSNMREKVDAWRRSLGYGGYAAYTPRAH